MQMTTDRILWGTGQIPIIGLLKSNQMPSCSYKLTQVPCLILDCCHHLALTSILTSYPPHPCKPAGPQPSHMIPLPWQLPELSKPLLTEFLPTWMPFPLMSPSLTHTLSPVLGDTEKALPIRYLCFSHNRGELYLYVSFSFTHSLTTLKALF